MKIIFRFVVVTAGIGTIIFGLIKVVEWANTMAGLHD